MNKSLFVILSCILCVLLFQAFAPGAKPAYKNLEILPDDISEAEMDTLMHHFSRSLGVKCNFCHVRIEAEKKMDFASDEKPEKKVARQMMRMSIELNKKYFSEEMEAEHDAKNQDPATLTREERKAKKKRKQKGEWDDMFKNRRANLTNMLLEVNCYTCHRGDAHPKSKLPPRKDGPAANAGNPTEKK